MNKMAKALVQAGLANGEDVKRAETEKVIEDKAMLRYDIAMSDIPSGIAAEMMEWMEKTNIAIPIKVIEKWGGIRRAEGVKDVVREWARWLSAYSDVERQMAKVDKS